MSNEPSKNKNLSPWLNTLAKLSGAGFSFLMLIILARNMRPEGFADFSVILAWLAIGTTIACYSMPLVLVRYVAENLSIDKASQAKGIVIFGVVLSLVLSLTMIALCIPLYYLQLLPLPQSLHDILFWVSLLFLASVLLTVFSGYLQGLKQVVAAELLINLTRPILLIIVIGVLVFQGVTPLSSTQVIVIYTAVSLLILVASMVYSYWQSPKNIKSAKAAFQPKVWLRTGSGFMLVSLVAIVHEKLDILLMSFLSTPQETAIYAVAAKFSQTILTATIAITAIMAPQLAERLDDLKEKRMTQINDLVHHTTKNMMVVTFIALLVFAGAGTLFLSLFGSFYTNAYWPLSILALGHFLASFCGPSLSLATFIGETRLAVSALVVGLIANASLSIWLTPIYGAVGAAGSMAFGLFITSFVACVLLHKKLKLYTFIFKKK